MSTFVSEVVVEWPVTYGSEIRSWKQSEPSSLLAREYAAALMRVTLGGFRGVTGRKGSRSSGTESRGFGRGADDGSVSTEGELLDSCCNGLPEKDAAQYPVNRGIVAGEPLVS